MAGIEQFRDLDPSAQLVTSYNAIPQEDRKAVLIGLRLATIYAPTATEVHEARQEYGTSQRTLKLRYSELADIYARSIDENFQSKGLANDPKTVGKRGLFYGMISTLTAEQIDKGVKEILHAEGRGTPGQK